MLLVALVMTLVPIVIYAIDRAVNVEDYIQEFSLYFSFSFAIIFLFLSALILVAIKQTTKRSLLHGQFRTEKITLWSILLVFDASYLLRIMFYCTFYASPNMY